jgi:hypothetical protein
MTTSAAAPREVYRYGVGSIALRGEVPCRNCNPAALLKSGNEIIIGGGKTDGIDHIELGERWRRREEGNREQKWQMQMSG